ncbi:MAG: tRNA-dihydrouridine synthase family protein, partial [Candidatus Doudnabacteria bacterium]|nr:tRNA-dihydrouridine synthase family protein [Candidatus Doudnabacteria bacterium]
MDQVTDCAFREMFARYGKPDVLFTEFVNVDGLLHPDGRKRLLRDLKFTEKQRPIVAQVWGTDPEKFYKAARIIKELKFDGLDINMGCPQSKEIALGAGAALILNPKLALKIIRSAKKGAGKMPVSIKTRIGFDKNIIK